MSSPIPTPMQAYDALPYHFSLIDQQPVVRIPVAGPPPFNTLAVVRTIAFVTVYDWADGKMDRVRKSMGTNLVLTGYDPMRPEQQQVRHSSSATLRMMQITAESEPFSDDNTEFTFAVDEVEADSWLDETGRWYVTVDVASSLSQVFAGGTVEVSSWVLCWEPPRQRPAPTAPPRPWRWPVPRGLRSPLDPAAVGLTRPRPAEDADDQAGVQPRRRRPRRTPDASAT